MVDLFEFKYPKQPGFKEATTSKDAAVIIAPRTASLRERVMELMDHCWPNGLTADEAAKILDEPVLAIRPRFSELRKLEQIHPSTRRSPNESGVMARVWVARKPA